MMKTLRLLMFSLLTLFCGTMMAEEVTIDFNNDVATLFPTITNYSSGTGGTYVADGEFNETTTSTAVSGVTATVSASAADAGTRNRLWATAPRLRMYDGTLTIASAGENITKMVITRSTNASKVANNNTVDSGTLTTSDQQQNGEVTWTGDAKSVTITIAGNTQFSKIVVTLGEGGGGEVTPPTPSEKKNRIYKKVTSVESGKAYLIVAEGKAAQALTSNYGYLKVDDATDNNGEIARPEENTNEFVFEATDGGYTIKQSDGRYLYQTGTYNSFNVSAEPTEGQVWTVEAQQDGTFKITNVNVTKYIQYSAGYTSYGSYPDEQGTMPALYVFDREEAAGNEPVVIETKAANLKEFAAVATDTEVELTLKDAVVLYVNVYNNTKEIFVRDATGAADLYELGISAEAGQVLNGTIIGKRSARSGFTVAMVKSDNTDASTVTVSGTAGDVDAADIGFDEVADYYCDYVVLKGVTIDAEKKNAVNEDSETIALYDRFKLGLLSDLSADGTKYDIYGLMYDGGATYGAELVVTKVTLAGGGEIQEEPATPVASIAALLGMDSPSSNLELTLTDAKVLFVDGNNYIYMRENGKALCFYQISGLKDLVKNNSVVNGKIQVDYEVYRLLPEVKTNKNTKLDDLTVVESEEEAVPTETTLANVAAGNNVCDLVTLTATLVREVTYKEDGETVSSTKYYLQDGDTKLVVVNNSKNLGDLADNAVETVVVTGIVNTASDAYQIKLTKNAVDPNDTGISTVSTDAQQNAIFNLAGQRMVKAQKGLYIIGGKKVILK